MNFYIFLLTKWKVGIAREILQHKICEKRVFFEIQETFQNCMISLAFRFKIFETLRVSMTSIAGCSCISYTRQGASRRLYLPFCSRGSKCFEPRAAYPSGVGNFPFAAPQFCTLKSKLFAGAE